MLVFVATPVVAIWLSHLVVGTCVRSLFDGINASLRGVVVPRDNWRTWILEDPSVLPYHWLEADLVAPAFFSE